MRNLTVVLAILSLAACAEAPGIDEFPDGGFDDIDAGRPDARPDASTGHQSDCLLQILGNGNFDASTGTGSAKSIAPWVELHQDSLPYLVAASSELPAGSMPLSGGYTGWLGATGTYHSLIQTFVVPERTVALRITGMRRIVSPDERTTNLDDFLTVNLIDGNTKQVVHKAFVWSEADESNWQQFSRLYQTDDYAGRNMGIELFSNTDGDEKITDFFIDDVQVHATVDGGCP